MPVGQALDMVNHMVMPVVTLTVIQIGSLMRYTRTNMLEVLNADYIRTARTKGLPEHKVHLQARVPQHAHPARDRHRRLAARPLLGAPSSPRTLFMIPGTG